MRTRFRRRSLRGSWISLAVKRKNRWLSHNSSRNVSRRTIVSDQERGRSSPVVPPINVQLSHSRHRGDARLLHAVELGATAMQMGTVGRTQAPANLASLINHASDAGVHALSNVCHVDVERTSKRKPGEVLPPHEPSVVRRAVNHFLQKNEEDIMVVDVRCVPTDFHARYKAQERTYYYRLLSGSEPLSTFEKDRAWHVAQDLNLHAMQEACKILAGHHDFSSFRAAGCQAKSPVRTLEELTVCETVSSLYFPSEMERKQMQHRMAFLSPCSKRILNSSSFPCNDAGDSNINGSTFEFGMRRRHCCFVVTARACSFLYHQVRLLVGVLKSVGTGDITISEVQRILDAKNITATSPMAPASGLYLGHVKYDLTQEVSD